MTRRTVIARVFVGVVLAAAVAAPAFGGDIIAQKQRTDDRIGALQGSLASKQQNEAALRSQIADVTSRIQSLEERVGDVSLHLTTLEHDLDLHRRRLAKLNQLWRLQTDELNRYKRRYAQQLNVLARRLVTIYEEGTPSTIDFLIGARSITDVLNQADYVTRIGKEDQQIAAQVRSAKLAVNAARMHTVALEARVRGEQRAISARAAQARAVRDALVGARDSLAGTQQQKLVALSKLTASEQAEASEIDALQAASNRIAVQIRAAQAAAAARASAAASDTTPADGQPTAPPPPASSSGLIWPVNGPVTSAYGWRWGRMHQGIDIGVPTGTPIHAAAAGTVIYCGWEEGYGNFVVLDNGGDLATAYGHQSSIAVTCGQHVNQGDVIGYTGCTGHCTGPHLHFEVRINGNPVDPLGYL
jgi:murein DD-endopeptidase MepM/ murein hydrolase activator NlpD